jgi:hypothetical protein
MLPVKNVYRASEFKHTDFLNSCRAPLIEDFLKVSPNYSDVLTGTNDWRSLDYAKQNAAYEENMITRPDSWNMLSMMSPGTVIAKEELRIQYPAAFKIVDYFGDSIVSAAYVSMEPQMIIRRHSDAAGKDATRVRVHIPLIIPKGDLGFECYAEEFHWDEIFAFNGQKAHSAWNFTDSRRLVFILDLLRSACDLPPAEAWYPGCNDGIPRFEKTERESAEWKKRYKRN